MRHLSWDLWRDRNGFIYMFWVISASDLTGAPSHLESPDESNNTVPRYFCLYLWHWRQKGQILHLVYAPFALTVVIVHSYKARRVLDNENVFFGGRTRARFSLICPLCFSLASSPDASPAWLMVPMPLAELHGSDNFSERVGMVREWRSGWISPILALQIPVKPSPHPHHQRLGENDFT